jgi:hypothetical protein
MRRGFTLGLFIAGGVFGGVVAIVYEAILPEALRGRWLNAIFALVGLVVGNFIDNNRESKRIARELEQDRIRANEEDR